MLQQAKNDNLYDRIYLVSPSANSNKAYFGKYINEEDAIQEAETWNSGMLGDKRNER